MRRRPLPPARVARLELEAQLCRPRLIRHNIQFEPGQLQQVDDERRVAAYGPVPSRAAMIRMLIAEALVFRRAGRSPPPRPAKGEPLPPALKARLER
jgi:hypothetical protein